MDPEADFLTQPLDPVKGGRSIGTGISNTQVSFASLYVGAFNASGTAVQHAIASIDELEIFDRALDQAEIQAIFAAGSAGKCKVINVGVDIKPGSDPNSINLCSNGAVPIAILGSDEFDVMDVDTETLRFAEAAVKVVGKKDPHTLCSFEDVNLDGFTDVVCHFVTTDIAALDGESTSATVNGELFDGTPIEGTDSVNIVKDTC